MDSLQDTVLGSLEHGRFIHPGEKLLQVSVDQELKSISYVEESEEQVCYLKLDEHKLAIASCDAALAVDPECANALYRRASARSALGSELDEAQQDLVAASVISPDDATVKRLLARVVEQQKRQNAKERAVWKKAFVAS